MVVSGWVRQAFEEMFGERTEEIIRLTKVMVRELGGLEKASSYLALQILLIEDMRRNQDED